MMSTDEFLTACRYGDIAVVRQYIADGGDVNVKDIDGWTALMLAAYNDFSECLCELIAAGADVNAVNNAGWTALMYAASYCNTHCASELIAAGADINIKNDIDMGCTALIYTIQNEYYYTASVLVQLGADIYDKDINGKSAIDYCEDNKAKAELIQLYQQRISTKTAIASADKPVIIKGFDSEL